MILLEVKKLRRMRMGLLIFAIMAAVILMSVARILGKASGIGFVELLTMVGMVQAIPDFCESCCHETGGNRA